MINEIQEIIHGHFGADGLTKMHHCRVPAERIHSLRYQIAREVHDEYTKDIFDETGQFPSTFAFDAWIWERLDQQEEK